MLNIRSLTSNKVNYVYNLISSNNIDIFALTEIWGNNEINTFRALSTPQSYSFLHSCRENRRGGGVGLICKNMYDPKVLNIDTFNTFELLFVLLNNVSLNIAVIYRTGPCSQSFFDEFSEFLVTASSFNNQLIILGDFNLPSSNNINHATFCDILGLFNLKQHVNEPTHIQGNILDLIIFESEVRNLSVVDESNFLSDHFRINFQIDIDIANKTLRKRSVKCFRRISEINLDIFKDDLIRSLSLTNNENLSANDHLEFFDKALLNCLDIHAPVIKKCATDRSDCDWFTEELRNLKRERRKCERQLNKAKRNNSDNLITLKRNYANITKIYFNRMKLVRETNTIEQWKSANKDSKYLYKSVNNLLGKNNSVQSNLSANALSDFFISKIENIRRDISVIHSNCNFVDSVTENRFKLNAFTLTDKNEVLDLVKKSKKTNTPQQSFPSKLFANIIDSVVDDLVIIFNKSLSNGIFPNQFKQACVLPIIKNANLDSNEMKNFRPISLLDFKSKLLERIVSSRLNSHLSLCNLHDLYQSGYKKHHSTETALLYVVNELRLNADKNYVSILLTLDLSAAFDTIDHKILYSTLKNYLGIEGTALSWLESYLSNRTQTVYFNDSQSEPKILNFGVPQGSVLGPLLFQIYLLPLGLLLRQLDLKFHFYADDVQIYIAVTPDSYIDQVDKIQTAYITINEWLSKNFLKLNPKKSEVLLIGKVNVVSQCKNISNKIKLCNEEIHFSNSSKNLGVIFDEQLSFKDHINSTAKSCLITLRNLSTIRNHFTQKAFEILINSLVTSKLDYCNSLYADLPIKTLKPLQLVQNFAARLIFKMKKYDHVMPLYKSLHWLPVTKRIQFKVLLLTYKTVNNLNPVYLSNALTLLNSLPSLRSHDDNTLLHIAISNSASMGDRSFTVFASKAWNKLPRYIRESDSVNKFKSNLKTFLFKEAFN